MLSKFLRRRREDSSEKNVDMTPMLDIVFILLIFFIVTTSFTKEQGLEIKRPSTSTTNSCDSDCPQPMIISIDSEDIVSIDNRIIDAESIGANLQTKLADDPRSPLLIRIHDDASNLALLTAVDQAKRAGLNSPTVSRWQ